MTKEDFNIIRTELLERGDEMVSIRDLVERFEEVDAYFDESPWNLGQIFSNFNVFASEKCVPVSVIDDIKVEISEKILKHINDVRGKKDRESEYLFALCDALEIIEKHISGKEQEVEE